jgi:hypothetical protein
MAVCPECGEPLTPAPRGTPTVDPGAVRRCPECGLAYVLDRDGNAIEHVWGADR